MALQSNAARYAKTHCMYCSVKIPPGKVNRACKVCRQAPLIWVLCSYVDDCDYQGVMLATAKDTCPKCGRGGLIATDGLRKLSRLSDGKQCVFVPSLHSRAKLDKCDGSDVIMCVIREFLPAKQPGEDPGYMVLAVDGAEHTISFRDIFNGTCKLELDLDYAKE